MNNHPNRRKGPDPIRQELRETLLRVLLSYDGVDGLGPQNRGQCEIIADDLARAGMARLRRRGDLFQRTRFSESPSKERPALQNILRRPL